MTRFNWIRVKLRGSRSGNLWARLSDIVIMLGLHGNLLGFLIRKVSRLWKFHSKLSRHSINFSCRKPQPAQTSCAKFPIDKSFPTRHLKSHSLPKLIKFQLQLLISVSTPSNSHILPAWFPNICFDKLNSTRCREQCRKKLLQTSRGEHNFCEWLTRCARQVALFMFHYARLNWVSFDFVLPQRFDSHDVRLPRGGRATPERSESKKNSLFNSIFRASKTLFYSHKKKNFVFTNIEITGGHTNWMETEKYSSTVTRGLRTCNKHVHYALSLEALRMARTKDSRPKEHLIQFLARD